MSNESWSFNTNEWLFVEEKFFKLSNNKIQLDFKSHPKTTR